MHFSAVQKSTCSHLKPSEVEYSATVNSMIFSFKQCCITVVMKAQIALKVVGVVVFKGIRDMSQPPNCSVFIIFVRNLIKKKNTLGLWSCKCKNISGLIFHDQKHVIFKPTVINPLF